MKTWQTLGYLGVLPFIIALFYSVNSQLVDKAFGNFFELMPDTSLNMSAIYFPFLAYSAVIISFLAGSMWRITLENNNRHLLLSNGMTVLVFSALFIPANMGVVLLALAYIVLFFTERRGINRYFSQKSDSAEKLLLTHYINMRLHLTLIVFTLHALAYVLWFL